MIDKDLAARLETLAADLDRTATALDECRADVHVANTVERANARDINKLKHHVATLQTAVRVLSKPTTDPAPCPPPNPPAPLVEKPGA